MKVGVHVRVVSRKPYDGSVRTIGVSISRKVHPVVDKSFSHHLIIWPYEQGEGLEKVENAVNMPHPSRNFCSTVHSPESIVVESKIVRVRVDL